MSTEVENDLGEISRKWLRMCSACDAGIGMCTHPTGDYRPVIDSLVDEVDRLRAALAAAKREGYQEAIEALRGRLSAHFLANIVCDHERKMDNPWCACSLVDLGWHPSVGEAVAAWIDHVLTAISEEGNE